MIIDSLPEDYIENKVQEICRYISKEGQSSSFKDIFSMIYEHIEDNIEKFLPEQII